MTIFYLLNAFHPVKLQSLAVNISSDDDFSSKKNFFFDFITAQSYIICKRG